MHEGYVSPWMTDELAALDETTRRFCEREARPHLERWEENRCVDREFWKRAGELGLLCQSVPEEWGGPGGDLLGHVVVLDSSTRTLGSGWAHSVQHLVGDYLLEYGTDEQRRRWLPGMASGDLIAAVAMTEPSAGSDLKAIRTTAVRRENSYVLNGSKTFISNATSADLVLVVAKTDPEAGARGISLLMVETNAAQGFSRGPALHKIGQHVGDVGELFFDDVEVPTGHLVGVENGAFGMMMDQLVKERLLVGVTAVAPMEEAVRLTVEHTKAREAFGTTLFAMQNTRFVLAEAATITTVSRRFLDDCLVRHLGGRLDATTAAMVKWWLTENQNKVIDQCLQLFGGYGYMREYPIARMYEDARVQKIYGGANEIMKELIARSL